MHRVRWMLPLGMLLVAASSFAQPPTPNAALDPLPARASSIDLEISLFDVEAHRSEVALQFPGDLRFMTARLRLAWAATERIAIGVEVPYRTVAYSPDLGDGVLRSQGIAGGGVFVDLAHHVLQSVAVLRIGYLRAAGEDDPVLSVSDGVDRLSMTWALERGAASSRWVGRLRTGLIGARERLPEEEAYGQAWLQFALGRRIASGTEVLALAGTSVATAAREEGSFLSKKRSHGSDAGLMLQWSQRELRLRLSATRTFSVVERFEGLRVTFSATRRFH